jgi:poly(A) polymerase
MRPAAPSTVPTTLAGAPWLVRPETRAVLAALTAAGHASRIVGGTVRNALLGEPVGDIDIATTAKPDEIMAAARAAGLQAIPTGASHGTVTVVADHMPFEITTLREDVETFGRHARVAFTADWEADARRRDFTINALYCDADGVISDPVGGLPDLVARRVRFIGDARARIREDALRILRFFRFHARYGTGLINADGLAACAQERHMLAHLSAERVRAELLKLLEAPGAAEMIAVMADHGFIVALLGRAPRIGTLARLIAQDGERNRPADALLRLSVLAVAVEEDRAHLAERLRLSREEARARVVVDPRLMALAALDDQGRRRALYALGADAWRRMVMAGAASAESAADVAAWETLAALPGQWAIPGFPLGGRDALALGLAPGPAVGALLAEIEAEWIAGDFVLDAEGLRARLAARARDSR